MRNIDKIIIHCSATPPSMDIGVLEIDQWHREREGWNAIGYHMVIRRDSTMERGRDLDRVGAHAKGFNTHSVGICLVGGVDEDGNYDNNFTLRQFKTLFDALIYLSEEYPGAEILGHRDLPEVYKSCPCFDVRAWITKDTKVGSKQWP